MEQALLTDQDNALVYADEGGEQRDWWQAFAERVNADLEAAGFPACPHGHMARSAHATISQWARRFNDCIDERQPHAAALLFDFRKVSGTLDVAPLEAAMGRASRNAAFLRFLARAAVEHEAPALGLRVKGTAAVDLKARGITPVVMLARCYGLEVGATARATLERLAAARKAGLVSEEALDAVSQGYRFLLGLRLRHQLRMLAEGRAPDSEVSLAALTAIERSRLKDAFRAIRRWQEKAAYHYRTDFF
jgi:CBS domain-containing protein